MAAVAELGQKQAYRERWQRGFLQTLGRRAEAPPPDERHRFKAAELRRTLRSEIKARYAELGVSGQAPAPQAP